MKTRRLPKIYPADQISFGSDNVQDAPRSFGGYHHRTPRPPTPFQKGSAPIQKVVEAQSHIGKPSKRDSVPHNRKNRP